VHFSLVVSQRALVRITEINGVFEINPKHLHGCKSISWAWSSNANAPFEKLETFLLLVFVLFLFLFLIV
jgi:hypothetical protein